METVVTMDGDAKVKGFYGRTLELEELRSCWESVATKREGPAIRILLAESGFGKTRLAQALYQQLAADPAWNPPDFGYWPDAFGGENASRRVNPALNADVPKGPPRFLWLGVRWEQDVRSISPLPELLETFRAHAETAHQYAGRWARIKSGVVRGLRRHRGEIAADVGLEMAGKALGFGVPGGGLMVKGLVAVTKDWRAGKRSVHERETEAHRNAGDTLIEWFGMVLGGENPLPVLLLLDDAHDIDAQSQQFIRELWDRARDQGWPLMLLVTHWEREWLAHASPLTGPGSPASGLLEIARSAGTCVVNLSASSRTSDSGLEDYLRWQLPGLSETQREILLSRAGGNFLTMVENVKDLRERPRAFIDSDIRNALTHDAERRLHELPTTRDEHVRKRFAKLHERHKELLGLGSLIGALFLRRPVETFAKQRLRKQLGAFPAEHVLSECANPYVVVEFPTSFLCEFRDHAWLEAARKYSQDFEEKLRSQFEGDLRVSLLPWIEGAFDEHGNITRVEDRLPAEGVALGVLHLGSRFRRSILEMAARAFPMPEDATALNVWALRTQLLLAHSDALDLEWELLKERVNRHLGKIEWSQIPDEVVSFWSRNFAAVNWLRAGAYAAAERLLGSLLARFAEDTGGTWTLRRDLKRSRTAATQCFSAAMNLAKAKRHLDQNEAALGLGRLAESLCRQQKLGDLRMYQALECQRRCLELLRRWDEIEELPFDEVDFAQLPDHYSISVLRTEQGLIAALGSAIDAGDKQAAAIQAALLGKHYRSRKAFGAAAKHYRIALEHADSPHQRRIRNALMLCLAQVGDVEGLRRLVSEAQQSLDRESPSLTEQDHAVFHHNVAVSHLLVGEPDRALDHLATALEWELKRARSPFFATIAHDLCKVEVSAHLSGREWDPDLGESCQSVLDRLDGEVQKRSGCAAAKAVRKAIRKERRKAKQVEGPVEDWLSVFWLARDGRHSRVLMDALVGAARSTRDEDAGLRFACWLGVAYMNYRSGYMEFALACLKAADTAYRQGGLSCDLECETPAGDFLRGLQIEVMRRLHYDMHEGDVSGFTGWTEAIDQGWTPRGAECAGWYALWLLDVGQVALAATWASKALTCRDKALNQHLRQDGGETLAIGSASSERIKPWIDRLYVETLIWKATMPWRMAETDDFLSNMDPAAEVGKGMELAETQLAAIDRRLVEIRKVQPNYQHPSWYWYLLQSCRRIRLRLQAEQGLEQPAEEFKLPEDLQESAEFADEVRSLLIKLGFD